MRFQGFSNFNKKQALGTLEQSSLAVYALFLTMALFKRKSNSTRLTGEKGSTLVGTAFFYGYKYNRGKL